MRWAIKSISARAWASVTPGGLFQQRAQGVAKVVHYL